MSAISFLLLALLVPVRSELEFCHPLVVFVVHLSQVYHFASSSMPLSFQEENSGGGPLPPTTEINVKHMARYVISLLLLYVRT